MIGQIYDILAQYLFVALMLLAARYVFLEPKWEKWQYWCNIVLVVFAIIIQVMFEAEWEIMIFLFIVGLNIALARKKHRIRGVFLVFPIFGMYLGLLQFLLLLPELLFGADGEWYLYLVDVPIWLGLLLFLWKGKTWREKFELEMQYRKLNRWESRLLIAVGMLMYGVTLPMMDEEILASLTGFLRGYMALVTFVAMILTITVVVLVMQGNKRAYYKGLAEVNEHYLKAEIKHFQAFREAQTETRRVRHDMKNHLACLMHLAKEKNIEELQRYLENMNVSVEQIDKELHCGNSIADAICNEKNQLAKQQGIAFEIEGQMPEEAKIEAVDICTIFANALDNAIEALADAEPEKKWMKLELSHQGDIIFLRFVNPVDTAPVAGNTSKTDKINHGFGLKNIRLAVEKYHGQMSTMLREQENETVFCLEIMLIMPI